MGRRRDAARLATASGLVLLLGGVPGSATLYLVALDVARPWLPARAAAVAGFAAVLFALFASLGGLTVLLGAHVLRARGPTLLARVLIDVGAGMGLLGLLVHVARAVAAGGLAGATAGLVTFQGVGVVLAVLAVRRLPRR